MGNECLFLWLLKNDLDECVYGKLQFFVFTLVFAVVVRYAMIRCHEVQFLFLYLPRHVSRRMPLAGCCWRKARTNSSREVL